MIKVIDGKRYNTYSAEHVFYHENISDTSDFHYRSKDLYRTKNGAWFLYHFGGALTDMAVSVQSGTGGSDDIEPVTDDDAFGFLQAHSDESEALAAIEKFFSDRVQDA